MRKIITKRDHIQELESNFHQYLNFFSLAKEGLTGGYLRYYESKNGIFEEDVKGLDLVNAIIEIHEVILNLEKNLTLHKKRFNEEDKFLLNSTLKHSAYSPSEAKEMWNSFLVNFYLTENEDYKNGKETDLSIILFKTYKDTLTPYVRAIFLMLHFIDEISGLMEKEGIKYKNIFLSMLHENEILLLRKLVEKKLLKQGYLFLKYIQEYEKLDFGFE